MLAIHKLHLLTTTRPFRAVELRAPAKGTISLPPAVMRVWLKLTGRLK